MTWINKTLMLLLLAVVILSAGCISRSSLPDNSGNPNKIESTSTPVPTPTPTFTIKPTSTVVITKTPEPTRTPEPVVVATPTGRQVYSRVKADAFAVPSYQIYAGDAMLWDNYDVETSFTYTIVELNGKLPNITLLQARKASYVFNTTGEYKFGLFYVKLKGEPSTQIIRVIANTSAKPANISTNASN